MAAEQVGSAAARAVVVTAAAVAGPVLGARAVVVAVAVAAILRVQSAGQSLEPLHTLTPECSLQ